MSKQIHDEPLGLYMIGGLERVTKGRHGRKRERFIELETSGLISTTVEISRSRSFSRWADADAFDEWPSPAVSFCS